MIDLIMYWSTVTVLVAALTAAPLFGLVFITHVMLYGASDHKFDLINKIQCKLWPNAGSYTREARYANCFGVSVMALLSVAALSLIVWRETGYVFDSIVGLIAHVSLVTYNVIGVVGTIGIAYLLLYFVMRKVFKFYYAVQDKLDKLK